MKYRYGKSLLTVGQLEHIAKRTAGKNWEERLAIMTRFPAEEIIERECLKCGKKFEAHGKFERVCQRCKGSEEWIDAELSIL
jgi:hypothetical protein